MISESDRVELIDLVRSIATLSTRARYYDGLENFQVAFMPPITPENREAVSGLFQRSLPEEYLWLLENFDGIQNFDFADLSILPSTYLLRNRNLDASFVDGDIFPAGQIFIFAQSRYDPHSLAFSRGTNGRLTVLEFDAQNDFGEYDTLLDYFRSRRSELIEELDRHLADREGLIDE